MNVEGAVDESDGLQQAVHPDDPRYGVVPCERTHQMWLQQLNPSPLTLYELGVAVIAQEAASFYVAPKGRAQVHEGHECYPSPEGVKQSLAGSSARLHGSPTSKFSVLFNIHSPFKGK